MNNDNSCKNKFAFLSSAIARRLYKAAGITALAFLLSSILLTPFSFSASTFVSAPEKNDFEMTDFYSIVADARLVRTLDKDITIVNIDNCNRDQIAEVLEILSICEPAVIGLDVMFAEPRENDERLLEAIASCRNIVMPIGVAPTDKDNSLFCVTDTAFFYPAYHKAPHGVTNLPTKYAGGTVREFEKYFPLDDGREKLPSFSVAVAEMYAPEAVSDMQKRGGKTELISFPSHDYRIYNPDEIADHVADLNGKIVLVGAMTEQPDLHSTPVHSQMAGIAIHARAISTILNGDYLVRASRPANWGLAFLLCLIIIFTNLSLAGDTKGLIMRLTQLGLIYLLIVAGYTLFVEKNLIIDISYALLMLTFGLFANDMWNGSAAICRMANKKFDTYARPAVSRCVKYVASRFQ